MDDHTTADGYSDPMSERLLGTAADVLRSFGTSFGGRHLAIVGGAVPSLLAERVPPGLAPHVGTADLDLHLSLHLLDGETADYYDAIIDGFTKLGLKPDLGRDGREVKWRWVGRHREAHLQVELLCPVRSRGGRPEPPAAETVAEKNIGPAGRITALAVGFGHLVPLDTVAVVRTVESARGRLDFEFPVCGVTSWLCLKSDAIMRRDKPKDAYDVVWLIASLGAERVAAHLRASPLLDTDHREPVIAQIARLLDQFSDVEAVGPMAYADFLDSGTPEQDRRFAVGALASVRTALGPPFN